MGEWVSEWVSERERVEGAYMDMIFREIEEKVLYYQLRDSELPLEWSRRDLCLLQEWRSEPL